MADKKCNKDCKCECKNAKEGKKVPPKDPFTEEEAFFDIDKYKKNKGDEKKGE